jgi:O-antigen/teichoic acid export membrane protein
MWIRWRRGGTTHRLSWGLADQAVSSLTNFTVVILVARSVEPREFGIFSLAYVTYSFALNVSRGLATDPMVVRYSGVSSASWRAAVRKSTGTATAVGCVIGACCVFVGLAVGGEIGATHIALGVILPGLLLQDSWRFAFFAAGQGHKSFANDLAWGVALVPLIALASQQASVPWFVMAWGGAGALAAAIGALQSGIVPRPSGTRKWLAEQRELGSRYLMENMSMSAATQVRIYGLGAIAGLSAVGSVRAAELLLGPWIAAMMGLSLVAVPEAARMLRRSVRALLVFCMALGGFQAAGAAAWGLTLMVVLPDGLGNRLLGSVWGAASGLILPTTIAFTGISISNGAAAGLRALAAARRSLRAQLLAASAYVVGGLGGALAGGAVGSAWGVAVATMIGAVVWWWQFRAGLRALHRSRPLVDQTEMVQDRSATGRLAMDESRGLPECELPTASADRVSIRGSDETGRGSSNRYLAEPVAHADGRDPLRDAVDQGGPSRAETTRPAFPARAPVARSLAAIPNAGVSRRDETT